jgi:hypothetical protein
MTEEQRNDEERPRESEPNPTQQRIDEELEREKRDEWETEGAPHEGEEGTEPV